MNKNNYQLLSVEDRVKYLQSVRLTESRLLYLEADLQSVNRYLLRTTNPSEAYNKILDELDKYTDKNAFKEFISEHCTETEKYQCFILKNQLGDTKAQTTINFLKYFYDTNISATQLLLDAGYDNFEVMTQLEPGFIDTLRQLPAYIQHFLTLVPIKILPKNYCDSGVNLISNYKPIGVVFYNQDANTLVHEATHLLQYHYFNKTGIDLIELPLWKEIRETLIYEAAHNREEVIKHIASWHGGCVKFKKLVACHLENFIERDEYSFENVLQKLGMGHHNFYAKAIFQSLKNQEEGVEWFLWGMWTKMGEGYYDYDWEIHARLNAYLHQEDKQEVMLTVGPAKHPKIDLIRSKMEKLNAYMYQAIYSPIRPSI